MGPKRTLCIDDWSSMGSLQGTNILSPINRRYRSIWKLPIISGALWCTKGNSHGWDITSHKGFAECNQETAGTWGNATRDTYECTVDAIRNIPWQNYYLRDNSTDGTTDVKYSNNTGEHLWNTESAFEGNKKQHTWVTTREVDISAFRGWTQ